MFSLEKFTYYNEKTVTLNGELEIPLPDGFSCEENVSLGERQALLIVAPEGCSPEDAAEYAELSFVITQVVRSGSDFKPASANVVERLFVSGRIFDSELLTYDVSLRDGFGILFQSADDDEDDSFNRNVGVICAHKNMYVFQMTYNHPEVDSAEVFDEFMRISCLWFSRFRLPGEEVPPYFYRAYPSDIQYQYYNRLANAAADAGVGLTDDRDIMDYQLMPVSEMAEDGDSREVIRAIEAITEGNTEAFELSDAAEEMKELFAVNDATRDRRAEIDRGYIQHAVTFQALRSFAWTLIRYCEDNEAAVESIDIELIDKIIDFCTQKGFLNYEETDECYGLCACADLLVYFVPEKVEPDEYETLMPSDAEEIEAALMSQLNPDYQNELVSAHSLDALREDLTAVYPAVRKLYDRLAENRNHDEPLNGNDADIVYAWCALANAAGEPFFLEEGERWT